MINNKIWFSLKVLLRDSNFDLSSNEFIKFHKLLEKKYNGNFTLNMPEKKYKFNEMVINRFCVEYCMPLLYKLYSDRSKKLDMKLEKIDWNTINTFSKNKIILEGADIWEDMESFKKTLIKGNWKNIDNVADFTKACIVKYGEEKTKYYFDTLFYDYFTFSI